MTSFSRTKKLLWQTLYELVKKEKIPFDSITINELCQHAMLHRTTFYKHFDDKYALLQFGYQLLCEERQSFSVDKRLFEPFSISEQLGQRHYFHTAYELANTTPYLQQLFQKMMLETIENDLQAAQLWPADIPKKLLLAYISSTLATVDYFWRTESPAASAQDMDALFKKLLASIMQISPSHSNVSY